MSNDSNLYPPPLHHKKYIKLLFSLLKIIKAAVRLGRDDQGTSDGYDGALLTFHSSVIYGPPAEFNTRLHLWLYYIHGLNNEHPCWLGATPIVWDKFLSNKRLIFGNLNMLNASPPLKKNYTMLFFGYGFWLGAPPMQGNKLLSNKQLILGNLKVLNVSPPLKKFSTVPFLR
jgi:hypothetical protein